MIYTSDFVHIHRKSENFYKNNKNPEKCDKTDKSEKNKNNKNNKNKTQKISTIYPENEGTLNANESGKGSIIPSWIVRYCNSTSIHGIKYFVGTDLNMFER